MVLSLEAAYGAKKPMAHLAYKIYYCGFGTGLEGNSNFKARFLCSKYPFTI
jgi:hypothetical protein